MLVASGVACTYTGGLMGRTMPEGYWAGRLQDTQRLVGTMRRTARFTTATGRHGVVVDHGPGGTSVTFKGSTRTFWAQGREVTIKGTKELVTISSGSVVVGGWNGNGHDEEVAS